MKDLWNDLRFATRMLKKSPGFTAVAVLSLGLGIGAGTAVYSLIDAALLRTLPVHEPERLVLLNWVADSLPRGTSHNGYITENDEGKRVSTSMPYPVFERFRDDNRVLSDTFAFADLYRVNVVAAGQAQLSGGVAVSGGYFAGLGMRPGSGRLLNRDDDRPGAEPVVVLDHAYWQTRFGGDPEVLGKPVSVNGLPFTIVGTTPQRFRGTLQVGSRPEVYLPMAHVERVTKDEGALANNRYWWVNVMGRLMPGVRSEQAQSALDVILARSVRAEWPTAEGETAIEIPRLQLVAGGKGMHEDRADMVGPLYIAAGACGIVLLIACANLASLLLARSETRRKEIALRLSLGASRLRLIRQLLTESVLLAAIGGAIGLWLANLSVDAIFGLLPQELGMQMDLDPQVNLRVLGFTSVIALTTGLLFGLAPALRASRLEPNEALSDLPESPRRGLVGTLFAGRALLVTQVALSLVLLVVAGLFARSLVNLKDIDPGFNPDGLLVFRIDPTLNGYEREAMTQLYEQIRNGVESLPGVRSATLSPFSLISGRGSWRGATLTGNEEQEAVHVHSVADNFLGTMQIPILAGRDLLPSDTADSPRIAVVNETFVKTMFPDGSPVGQRFLWGSRGPEVEVVGVARDAKNDSLRRRILPTVYQPYSQARRLRSMTFVVRTDGDPAALVSDVRRIVRGVDTNLPMFEVNTMLSQMDESLLQERQFAWLAALFGGAALALCCIGLYGMLSHLVVRRTREFGIRQALGARTWALIGLIMREMRLVFAGVVLGLGASLLVTRWIASLLFGLAPTDPWSLVLAAAVMIGVAAWAAYLPARRAARVDPLVALRYE